MRQRIIATKGAETVQTYCFRPTSPISGKGEVDSFELDRKIAKLATVERVINPITGKSVTVIKGDYNTYLESRLLAGDRLFKRLNESCLAKKQAKERAENNTSKRVLCKRANGERYYKWVTVKK